MGVQFGALESWHVCFYKLPCIFLRDRPSVHLQTPLLMFLFCFHFGSHLWRPAPKAMEEGNKLTGQNDGSLKELKDLSHTLTSSCGNIQPPLMVSQRPELFSSFASVPRVNMQLFRGYQLAGLHCEEICQQSQRSCDFTMVLTPSNLPDGKVVNTLV